MNTDIRDIPKLIKIKDPRSVWAVVSLVIAIILFAIVSRLLVTSIIERNLLQEDLDATQARIMQIQGMQETNPEVLRQRIEKSRRALQEVLAGFPSTQQIDDELGRYYLYANELGTQIVRMEAMLNVPEEAQEAYRLQRFLLGVRGEMPQLLRFLGRISNVPYRGVIVDNIAIRPDGGAIAADAIANADLTIYAIDPISATAPIPKDEAPAPTPTLRPSDNINEIETYMRRAIADQDWAAAVAHGRHILQLDPNRQDIARALYQAHVNWGRVLAAAGQVAEARQQYQEALTLVPDGPEAQEGLRALDTPTPASAIPRAFPIVALPRPTALAPTTSPAPASPTPAIIDRVRYDLVNRDAPRHHSAGILPSTT